MHVVGHYDESKRCQMPGFVLYAECVDKNACVAEVAENSLPLMGFGGHVIDSIAL